MRKNYQTFSHVKIHFGNHRKNNEFITAHVRGPKNSRALKKRGKKYLAPLYKKVKDRFHNPAAARTLRAPDSAQYDSLTRAR